MNANSGVRRMVSGFALRNGANGTTNITVREVLPAWAQRVQNKPTLTAAQYGPPVNATYLLGHYIEDFDYRGDLSPAQTQGVDFDLNEQNVRFCVTPEFPAGTWAYFTTINADNSPAYPYTTGRQYFGTPTGGGTNATTMNADTPLTQHFLGGANTPLTIGTPNVAAPNVTLTWSSVEGGTYSAEASTDQTNWTPRATGIVASTTSTSATYATLASSGTEYGQVNRTALATYDATGQTPATVGQGVVRSFLPGGTALAPTAASPTSASVGVALATLGGNVTSDGGAAITARGVVYALTSANSNPQIGGSGVTDLPGTGTTGLFTVSATGLIPNSGYTFKAYATNSVGTAYSPIGSFTTLTASAPTVTSPTATAVASTSATLGGTVTSDGGSAITARGVVFAPTATNSNPQLGGSGVTNVVGSGTTGVFTVHASGLAVSTGYTYAAYATNSVGTTYSVTGTFTASRHNILLIVADDFGLDASSLYNTSPGVSLAPTPNLASLATGGVKFANAYSYALCSPTRSAVLTGRFGFRTGTGNVVGGASNNSLLASEFTLPEAFAAHSDLDYQLKHVGKWHLDGGQTGPCLIGGWPSFVGGLLGEVTDFYSWTKVTGSGATASSATSTTYATTDNVNDALAFIGTQTTAGKPWFTWVAFNAPHTPYHKPPDNLHSYDTTVANWAALPVTGNSLVHYNAAIEAMDTEIGRLLAGVDLNTTTIIFIGDNGTPTATLQSPYPAGRGKATLYEGGIRVPMIVRGPNVLAPGRTATQLVHVVDLYSTILELAGINAASTVSTGTVLDSQSLLPVLQNQAVTRPLAYSELFDTATPTFGGQELRDTQYKLIRPNSGADEFYDLQADPYESINLLTGGVNAMTASRQSAYYQLAADIGAFALTAPTAINALTLNPSVPAGTDNVAFTANVTPASSTTISGVQLTYNTGLPTTTTLWSETMAAAAISPWTGTGASNTWTLAWLAGRPNPYAQTTAANSGTGNPCGLEFNRGSPALADNSITTAGVINATGTGGSVEFSLATSNLAAGNGWTFQLSPDGITWTTRLSETTGSNHGYQVYHYDLAAGERVSTLKMRFQFAGNGPANPASRISLDDIKVASSTGATPQTLPMTFAGSGNYTAAIPPQPTGTIVSYTITATDSAGGFAVDGGNYTVVAATPSLTVTPSTNFFSSGTAGSGLFTPLSQAYTLTNSGTGTMNWTATKSASWLTLSSASGTLAVGASAAVTASINPAAANALSPATYNDTITFTNSTNGVGNTTRSASLVIGSNSVPATPTLTAMATFSQGTSRTVAWGAIAGATSYTLQISTTADFSSVLSSQTVSSPTATFANLTSGVTYYYRVLATNGVGSSIYGNVVSSTQDAVAPVVAITAPATGTSTGTNSITVSGASSDVLSGISKVTVNGVTATTANGFATWTITTPLGFGTNSITALAIDNAGNTTSSAPLIVTLTAAQTYNPLVIPDLITGSTFNLSLNPTTKQFLSGAASNTNAYNGMRYGAPTLIMNKGEWVQMNVTNNLAVDTTTTHWHGFHIPAIMDGGPHQTIPAGTTWSPSWEVMNNAGTYWYHPHLHERTQEQISRGAVGMIIIRDPQESALALPRTYGVDDLPLALCSRRFTANQIVTANSAYGDVMLVNGVINPQVSLPKQYVRLRILNAEIERSLNLGFSDNRTFWVIATDGGLVDAPVATTRVLMGVGERYEILVDLTNDTLGSSIDLRCYNNNASLGTPLANSYPGGEPQTTGQFGSLLNNLDFNVLHMNIAAQTASPILARPATLTTNDLWMNGDVTNPTTRVLNITGGAPGVFFFNTDQLFSPTVFNQTVSFNAVERWTITNTSGFSHSFHIHDIQFNLISRVSAGAGPASVTGISPYEVGWKDTLYVQRNSSVTFLAKFDHFASNTNPFMYHCHFANHEDEGLMGQFVVVNGAQEDLAVSSFTRIGSISLIVLDFKATPGTTYTLQYSPSMSTGSWSDIGSVTSDGSSATFVETDGTRLGQSRGFYRVTIPAVP